MAHRPIILDNISLSFPHKTCFENFSAKIHYGQRIGIIGKNGSGKSSLLRLIQSSSELVFGFVPQVIQDFESLSGGQRLNKALSTALAQNPDVLCLDEPTNHLDARNRHSLMRMLQNFKGTLLIASHDVDILRSCVDTLWHIDDGKIEIFAGKYEAFVSNRQKRLQSIEGELNKLQSETDRTHDKLMHDQERAKKKRLHGEKKYDGDKLALRSAQGRGERTTNKNRKKISSDKKEALAQLSMLKLPEVIKPKFSLSASELSSRKPIVAVGNGSCGYSQPVLRNVHLQLKAGERMLISGNSGSGKTTLTKAIMGDTKVQRTGSWIAPDPSEIGYLDQHYATLDSDLCAVDIIRAAAPHWLLAQIRDHLNSFLFRKNEEVFLPVKQLSGGEKARLSLAQIAAKTPKLLILDEVTNNIDLDTREHVIQVLRDYPGAMILISHDEDFAKEVGVETCVRIKDFLPSRLQ